MVIVLDENRISAIPGNCLFEVLSGQAWITRKGNQADFILGEGQGMELRGHGWVAQGIRSGKPFQFKVTAIRPLSATVSASVVRDVAPVYPVVQDRDAEGSVRYAEL